MAFFPPVTNESKGPKELIPANVHEAYCYGIVDCGTQERKPYLGKPKDPARALLIFFEFPDLLRQFKEDAPLEPMVKSQQYTYFTDEKSSLAKLVKSWLGKKVEEVDFAALAGTPASITIAHAPSSTDPSKIYDNMTAITAASPKLIPLMTPMHNKPMNFSIDEDGFDSPKFEALYPWVKDKISKSLEYQEYLNGPKRPAPQEPLVDTEDAPFK